jgi:hypothetical protein
MPDQHRRARLQSNCPGRRTTLGSVGDNAGLAGITFALSALLSLPRSHCWRWPRRSRPGAAHAARLNRHHRSAQRFTRSIEEWSQCRFQPVHSAAMVLPSPRSGCRWRIRLEVVRWGRATPPSSTAFAHRVRPQSARETSKAGSPQWNVKRRSESQTELWRRIDARVRAGSGARQLQPDRLCVAL